MRYLLPIVSAVILFIPIDGHVVLENPKPFLPVEYGPSNPVEAATFPCKVPAGKKLEIDGSPTEMAIGDDQHLTFQGRAVHGGGSCQISLTQDIDDEFQPRKDSRFFVIHSIEGGCPARGQSGNLEGPNTDRYSFKVPAGVTPGKYVLSWTWVPRIGGQPEYYMNCAPIVVSPAKTRRMLSAAERRDMPVGKRENFPDLWMANLGDLTGNCTHNDALKDQIAISYPSPGESVEYGNPGEQLFSQLCDGNPRAGTGSSFSPNTSAIPSITLSSIYLGFPSTTPLSLVEISSSAQMSTITPSEPETTEISMATLLTTTYIIGSSTPVSAPATSSAFGGACQEGYLLCVDGTHFSTCTGGQWTRPQLLAAKTHCTGGAGIGLVVVNE